MFQSLLSISYHCNNSFLTLLRGFLFLFSVPIISFSQTPIQAGFVLNGDAAYVNNSYFRLTLPGAPNYYGTMWYSKKADLKEDFDLIAYLNFGTNDDYGADGITFTWQNRCLRAGSPGGGMGVEGVSPSLVIKFDTFQNPEHNDPSYDHVAILKNGDFDMGTPNTLTSPVCILSSCGNVETGQNYKVRIHWAAQSHSLKIYVQDELRAQYLGDIVRDIFEGSSNVYWGFTAAVGAFANDQRVQIIQFPNESPGTSDVVKMCKGDSVELSRPGFVSYSWIPNQYISDATSSHPSVFPPSNATYYVSYMDTCHTLLIDTVKVLVQPKPTVKIVGNKLLCHKESTSLQATGALTYTWSTGSMANPLVVQPSGSTLYGVSGKDANGCKGQDTITVHIKPELDTSIIRQVLHGKLTARETQATYTWAKCGEGAYEPLFESSDPQFIVPSAGNYILFLKKDGCKDTSTCFSFFPIPELKVPNAFSPNGDGHNEVWRIEGIEAYPQAEMRVYNRWGTLVFHSLHGYKTPWDGKEAHLPSSTYYYILDLKGSDDGSDRQMTGSLTVLR